MGFLPGSGSAGGRKAPKEFRRRPRRAARLTAVLPVLLFGLGFVPISPPPGGHGVTPPPAGSYPVFAKPPDPASIPIQHIVIDMQENHAYDNYFGHYCRFYGPNCAYVGNGTPNKVCEPLFLKFPKIGCDKPWAFPNATAFNRDLVHDWNSSHKAYDNGSMDGFVPAEQAGNLTMGYYGPNQIGAYWDVAEQFGLGDNFYSSAMSYSLANHWFLLAGGAPPTGEDEYVSPGAGFTPSWPIQQRYLNESNQTLAIDDLLLNSSVSWSYYDFPLANNYSTSISKSSAFSYWNPLAAKAESYGSNLTPHFLARNQFFTDARKGNLPNVSWVIPAIPDSEHPPFNITTGEQWGMNVIQAVENSPEWNSTALFITWDEYGGFYDHVAPPVLDGVGLSFRVPLLIVSPYVRENYINHNFGSFESLLKFVEWKFGLANLTIRDQQAMLPLQPFDFSATPRPPVTFASAVNATYPMTLQPLPPPGAPTNITVQSAVKSLRIYWKPPVGGTAPTFYRLSYYPKGTPSPISIRIDGAAHGFVLTQLAPNTTYYFGLQAATPSNFSSTAHGYGVSLAPPGANPSTPIRFPGGGALAVTTLVTAPSPVAEMAQHRATRRPEPVG
jgi:phospholipase C